MKHTITKFFKKSFLARAAVCVALVVLLVGGWVFWKNKWHTIRPIPKASMTMLPATDQQLHTYAQDIVKKCSEASYKPTCYEDEIPKLMDSISMEQTLQVTSYVQDVDKSYAYCHVLGHKIAERETAKDPSKWKEVMTRCPSGLCSNGCIHGAFQERFRADHLDDQQLESVKPELMNICEKKQDWDPTQLEQATCYHALGHLLMYATNANVVKADQTCRDLALRSDGRDYTKLCYDGVYMQIFQPLEPDDFALIEGKVPAKDKLASYCKQYDERQAFSCWVQGWPLYRDEILTSKGAVNFCSVFKNPSDVQMCYLDIFYVVTAQVQFDTDKMTTYCDGMPTSVIGQCFANTASRLIETDYRNTDRSVGVCNAAPKGAAQDRCFSELLMYSTYNFKPGSPQFYKMCDGLPGDWKTKCLQGAPVNQN